MNNFRNAAAIVAALVSLFAGQSGAAQGTAALPEMAAARLSPDGTYLAYLRPHQGQTHVAVEDLRPGGRVVIIPPVEDLEFTWVRWANNERLIMAMEFANGEATEGDRQTRLIAADRDGTHIGSIILPEKRVKTGSRVPADMDPAERQDDVIAWLPDDPKRIYVSLDADHDGKVEVREVDVRSGKFKVIQVGLPGVEHWLADGNNDVRLGWGELGGDPIVWYGAPGNVLERTEAIGWLASGYVPLAFTEQPGVVFAIGPLNNHAVIRKLDLASGEFVETVFEQDGVDAQSLLVDAHTNTPIGVTYMGETPGQTYFHEEMQVVQRTIDKAVPDASNRVVSTSSDRRQVLVYSETGDGPGAYYLWNRDAKSFQTIGQAMQNWAGEFINDDRPVSYVAQEGF